MNQVSHQLCRTLDIRTVDCSFAFFPYYLCMTGRAIFWQLIGRIAAVFCNSNHFRNDIPCFADDDFVADCDLFFIDKVLIVQHCAADSSSRQLNRFKDSGWGQCSGSSDLNFNIQECRYLFFWRIFKCHCPLREFCSSSEHFPLRKAVHLNDRSVDIKTILPAALTDGTNLLDRLFDGVHRKVGRRNLESQFL